MFAARIQQGRSGLVALVVAAVLASAAPAQASYGWPIKPFHRQHAVRAFFGDPRIAGNDEAHGSFHFGIDIPAPNGSPVYATLDGIASIDPRHRDVVVVTGRNAVGNEYWHVVPAVRPGRRVVAYRTVVGHVEAPWAHVHFSETARGVYVNPLRRGALWPYRDRTRPAVHTISFERDGVAAGDNLTGRVDLVAEAFDRTPLPIAAPWHDKPVTPALVEWRLIGPRRSGSSWRIAADFRYRLPAVPFGAVYARWTQQNHPWGRGGTGRYRFLLARAFDTRSLADGTYRLVVRACDDSGNAGETARFFTVANGV
jgi:hypothetical protein